MPVTYQDVRDEVARTYIISDEGLIKLILAAVIANRLPISPVWLFIIGGSGSGKTAFIDMVSSCKWIYQISSITPNTFLSGFKSGGMEASFLSTVDVKKGGVMIFKDFTTILSKRYEEKVEILAQMREVYDGTLTKRTGQGGVLSWDGRLGLIAATTDAIYKARELYSSMGERFIMYNPITPGRKEVALRSINNLGKLDRGRNDIKEVVQVYLDEIIQKQVESRCATGSFEFDISDELKEEIVTIADMTCLARSSIEHDSFSKEITHVYIPEMPTRLSEQLISIAVAFQIINGDGKLKKEDHNILYKIAIDSIASNRRIVMKKLSEYQEVTTAAIAVDLHYTTGVVKRWLEDLNALQIVDRIKGGNADRWKIKEEYRKVMARFDGVTITNKDLIEKDGDVFVVDAGVAEKSVNNNPSEEDFGKDYTKKEKTEEASFDDIIAMQTGEAIEDDKGFPEQNSLI